MPAALPGSSRTANTTTNPSLGQAINFDALSGSKGSPLDKDNTGNASTGALCTGIGFGCNAGNAYINIAFSTKPATAAQALDDAGFTDDTGEGIGSDSTRIYIGGGRMVASATKVGVPFTPSPYTTGFVPCNAGNGGSRDAGAGPAFTGFTGKWVTATASVANGAVVETGFVNRSGVTIASTNSVFGSTSAAQAAPA